MSSRITTSDLPLLGDIAPQSVAAAGSAQSGWMDAGSCINVHTEINLGALGGGTVTATWEQATTSAGAGAKSLSAWTGGSSATNNANISVDNDPEKLDIAGGFRYVRLTLANVGGTGALCSAVVQGASPRYAT